MKKRLIIPIVIVVGLLVLTFGLPKKPFGAEPTLFKVEKGETSKDIALHLEKEGAIWWGPLFRLYVLVRGVSGEMQAGTYRVSPSMSIFTIAERLAAGKVATQTLTIPEGFTAEQIYEKLLNLKLAGRDIVNLEDFKNHEGYLFPDTYGIPYDLELVRVIEMMTDNFVEKTADLEITPGVVIMASILEKEVKTKEEKELAAGVLWKRLAIGMPLQVDAWPQTYEKLGLPERPISNPGLESILAALNPKESPYWYYLSKPDGETIFSKTLIEHNLNKAKYLK